MKLQIHRGRRGASPRGTTAVRRGFALIVTLSLMILLTVIAVGLLTLSTITLRSSSQGDAQQVARANARVALMLAIGDLQKQLGPDTRVSVTADQTANSDPAASSTPQTQRQWAGAYKAWPAGLPADARPAPEFLQWFVSGDPKTVTAKNFADTAVSGKAVDIVTSKTVGSTGDPVRVPLLMQTLSNGTKSNYGWWVSDLGTKGSISKAKDVPTAIADVRADQQAAPSFNLKTAAAGTLKPFNALTSIDSRLSNLASWQTSALLADRPENIRGLFHDFTTQNRGLLTNVRAGGFRKDLSMALERPVSSQPNSTTTALYKVGGENGINLQELWAYYNLCSPTNSGRRGLQTSGSATFTTGGTMASGTPYLQLESSPLNCVNDDFFYFKQPVIISYQMVLSLQTRVVNGANRLHLVTDPIITFWNPLDVPVVVPSGVVFTVKYWQEPYDIVIKKGSTVFECPVAAISAGDGNFLSLEVGGLERIVMKPGEVLKMSQSSDLLARSQYTDNIHALAGKKGFNFGKGMAWEAATRAGTKIDVAGNETLVFDSAKPNNLTAGATTKDGHSLTGGAQHSRHFSITHHEYYVGKDRDESGESLGIGGMFLDWDFGNKRLAPTATRATNDPGTKPTTDRYYANERPDIFKTFADGRSIPTTGSKMPIMLLSFNAKTETSSSLGTRSLSRFNPKALHVDFYDLKTTGPNSEREMLPYEYTAEILNGWKSNNDSLQQDATGRGYFGAAMNALDGTNYVTTHTVPREPIVSLAAFQHSFANGFEFQKPKEGYAILNSREPLLPQISHAIGNSMACPTIDSSKTEGTLPGGRPMADHSYLANQALWDDWFLSGIAPQNGNTFGTQRSQKAVASEFFDPAVRKSLPVVRYLPNLRGKTSAQIVSTYFAGSIPSNAATDQIASYLMVDGMFNVNSTSVEAWKSLLGARNGRPVVIRDSSGKEAKDAGRSDTPVAGLLGPENSIAKGSGSFALNDAAQWVGRRTLSDDEIESLAKAIVREVRKRGPFLSLADFVNRRVGTNAELARSGAIQSALDSNDVPINSAYNSSRAAAGGKTFAFKQAEQGPVSYGIPGIVKQADILTPIAPVLSARSDSFLVRGYGEKTDDTGKVIARAWCEAVVQRGAGFVDPADLPEKSYSTISTINKNFGRRFEIVSFRWLSPSEA